MASMKEKTMLINRQREFKEQQVEFIDLKTLDLKGKLHSLHSPQLHAG